MLAWLSLMRDMFAMKDDYVNHLLPSFILLLCEVLTVTLKWHLPLKQSSTRRDLFNGSRLPFTRAHVKSTSNIFLSMNRSVSLSLLSYDLIHLFVWITCAHCRLVSWNLAHGLMMDLRWADMIWKGMYELIACDVIRWTCDTEMRWPTPT